MSSVVESFVGPVAALLNTKAQSSEKSTVKLGQLITSNRTCSFEKGSLFEGHMTKVVFFKLRQFKLGSSSIAVSSCGIPGSHAVTRCNASCREGGYAQ